MPVGFHASVGALLLVVSGLLAGAFDLPPPPEPYGLSDPGGLTVHDGDLVITNDYSVVENLEIRGSLRIEGAQNVIVRNCWIYTTDFWTVYASDGATATFEHIEIGNPDFVGYRGIGGENIVVRFADIHDVEDGIKLDSHSLYEYVYVHGLDSDAEDPHADAAQVDGDVTGAVIRNSVLDSTGPLGTGNAAAQIRPGIGPISDVRIENSYLNGGAYTVFVRSGEYGIPQDIAFVGNRFGRDYVYGLFSLDGPIEAENNVWDDTGEPITVDVPETTTTSTSSTTTTTMPVSQLSEPPDGLASGQSEVGATPDAAAGPTGIDTDAISVSWKALLLLGLAAAVVVTAIVLYSLRHVWHRRASGSAGDRIQ